MLPPEICGIKVGKELFTACGPEIIEWIQKKEFKVFLDLKYHDIPNTVKNACFVASKMGVSILNVHALGGKDMMLAAKEGVDKSTNNPGYWSWNFGDDQTLEYSEFQDTIYHTYSIINQDVNQTFDISLVVFFSSKIFGIFFSVSKLTTLFSFF
mgnify:CR=1 FL=1